MVAGPAPSSGSSLRADDPSLEGGMMSEGGGGIIWVKGGII